jgi:hypothetical protein
MTSSNKTDDSPIVFLTAGRTEQGSNAPQEVAEVTGGTCVMRKNQLHLETLYQFIARSLHSVHRYFESTIISACGTEIVQELLAIGAALPRLQLSRPRLGSSF